MWKVEAGLENQLVSPVLTASSFGPARTAEISRTAQESIMQGESS